MNSYNNDSIHDELPIGLVMALAMNPESLNYFANLPKQQQQEIINHSHLIDSKQELRNYVNNLTQQNF